MRIKGGGSERMATRVGRRVGGEERKADSDGGWRQG